MLGVPVIAYGVAALTNGLLGPLRLLRTSLEMYAGAVEEKEEQLATLDLLLSPEQLAEVLNNPVVAEGKAKADVLKHSHAVPVCGHCGAVDYGQ